MSRKLLLALILSIGTFMVYFQPNLQTNVLTIELDTGDRKKIAAFPPDYEKRRVIVSTDIGGGDFDDVQSMIHYLLYADMFDTEAIISSMPRPGDKYWKKIVRAYSRDYENLSFHSADYPTPAKLKKLYVLGSTSKFPGNKKRGAKKIVKAVLDEDPRPVFVLIWGASTDVAIAVKILKERCQVRKKCNYKTALKRLQPIFIANYYKAEFNRQGDEGAYQYLLKEKKLKKIVVSEMFRGIYMSGLFGEDHYGNVGFVKTVIRKHGKLGKLFYRMSATINVNKYGIKMGDSGSVFFAMNGNWENLKQPTWAGKYCRVRKDVWAGCLGNAIGSYEGAGYIAKYRYQYLDDFEDRLKRLDKIETLTLGEPMK